MARLSLERIYADENGQPIPRLLDVYPDGTEEYEPQEDPVTKLGQTLFRIFQERRDVFDIDAPKRQDAKDEEESDDDKEEQPEKATQKMSMTPEDLMKMRNELMPQLHIAMGEMSLARDLLALLLSNSPPTAQAPALAVSTVSKPPPIPSVAAFNTLLTTGGKDESLRSASDVLGTAAREIERVNESNEKYWQNALLVRSSGWGLVPAPLPPGTSGGNKFARDFLISYGLEQASPPFKRRALAQLSTNSPSPLTFPAREGLRLRVTYETANGSSSSMVGRSKSSDNLDEILRDAQSEVVESEIFRRLIEEAGSLPTAGARVSEKLIVVEAAQGVDLKFELVDEVEEDEASQPESIEACLIGSVLRLYLLQMHRSPRRSSRLLQPIIDVVQYVRFCERVEDEVTMMASSLRDAGFKVRVRFQRVGEGGEGIVGGERMGGEAVLRVDGRHTVRLTMEAPCRLVAHLGRATLGLSSMSQLSQLLREEMEDYLLRKICEAGPEAGGWVVDRMTGSVVGNVGGENRQVSVRFGTRYGIECRVGSRAFSGGRLRLCPRRVVRPVGPMSLAQNGEASSPSSPPSTSSAITISVLIPIILFPLSTLLLIPALVSLPTPQHLPTSLQDLAALAAALHAYAQSGPLPYLHLLAVLSLLTLWKHAWSIPGAVLLNILAGSLLGSLPATLLFTLLTTCGSLLSSLLAAPLSPILSSFSPRAISLTKSVVAHDPAWMRLAVLRLVGVVPWSGLNIACGLCSVPLFDCALGAFIGTLPWTAVTCQLGDLLQTITVSGDETVTLNSLLRSPDVVTKLVLLTALSLAPMLAKEALKGYIAADTENTESGESETEKEKVDRGRTKASIVHRLRTSLSRGRHGLLREKEEDLERQ